MKKKTVYIGFAFLHHKGTHAGYHQIREYMDYDYVIDCQTFFERSQCPFKNLNIIAKIKRKIFNRLFNINCIPWYMLKIILLGMTHTNLVFHFVYGENIFFPWIRFFIRKGNKIVCTLHQPYGFFQASDKRKKIVLYSDNIILVGNTEVDKFKMMTDKDNVTFIPHGISTNFYNIDNNVKKENIVLTVGNWLRDFQFADKVYSQLLKEDNNIQIHIISNLSNKAKITPNERIKFMSGISDEELKQEYLKSGVLFLPLTRYTANNSLLESGATGCNIVVASDYLDNSYIPKDFISLSPMQVEPTVKEIKLYLSYEYNRQLSDFVVNNYSWHVIAEKTKNYLLNI